MAHHEVRLARYNEFNPNVSKWRDDKRSYERATGALKVLVAKNYCHSLVLIPILISIKTRIDNIFGQNTPPPPPHRELNLA